MIWQIQGPIQMARSRPDTEPVRAGAQLAERIAHAAVAHGLQVHSRRVGGSVEGTSEAEV